MTPLSLQHFLILVLDCSVIGLSHKIFNSQVYIRGEMYLAIISLWNGNKKHQNKQTKNKKRRSKIYWTLIYKNAHTKIKRIIIWNYIIFRFIFIYILSFVLKAGRLSQCETISTFSFQPSSLPSTLTTKKQTNTTLSIRY